MIESRSVPRSNTLPPHQAGQSAQSAATVRQRMPITRSTTRSPGAVRTQVGRDMERSPAATLEVIPSQAPRRR
jgi:hypothetical protein